MAGGREPTLRLGERRVAKAAHARLLRLRLRATGCRRRFSSRRSLRGWRSCRRQGGSCLHGKSLVLLHVCLLLREESVALVMRRGELCDFDPELTGSSTGD